MPGAHYALLPMHIAQVIHQIVGMEVQKRSKTSRIGTITDKLHPTSYFQAKGFLRKAV